MHYVSVALSAILAVAGLGELLGSTLAEEATPVSVSSLYTGVVLEPSGAPAVDCRVWLLRRADWESICLVEEVRTDREGRFRLNTPRPELRPTEPVLFFVMARDSQGRFADGSWSKLTDEATGADVEPELLLFYLSDYRGRLVDSGGKAIAGAVIEPTYFGFAPLPQCVAAEMGTATASDGTFTLKVCPIQFDWEIFPKHSAKNLRVIAEIAAGEYGRVSANWNFDKPLALRLEKPGCVCGSLACASNPTAVAGITLKLVAIESETTDDSDYSIFYHGRAVTQSDGEFRFDGVVPGKYRMMITADDQFPYYLDSSAPFEVKSGQTVSELGVTLKQKMKIRGAVVDAATGAGVRDAQILVSRVDEAFTFRAGRTPQTDAQGSFVAYACPGKIRIRFDEVPDEYRWSASRQDYREIDLTTDTTLPPVRLERTPVVEGEVVDESGRPVPNAQILTSADTSKIRPFLGSQFTTDVHGKFRLAGLLIKERFSLRVSAAAAATNGPLMFDPADKIRVVISPKNAFAIHGRVLDRHGQPLEYSQVCLRVAQNTDSGSPWTLLREVIPDSDGKFEFCGLCPGEQYSIWAESDAYESIETPQVTGEAGRTHDFGPLKMTTPRSVAGKALASFSAALTWLAKAIHSAGDEDNPKLQ